MSNEMKHDEVVAAITMALFEYQGGTTHDNESGRLTRVEDSSDWNAKWLMQRRLPLKKF